jgi:histidine ammonia-lyase
VRSKSAKLTQDRALSPEIEAVSELVATGVFAKLLG